MSRSFHAYSGRPKNFDLIERRLLRRGKNRWEISGTDLPDRTLRARISTQAALKQIMWNIAWERVFHDMMMWFYDTALDAQYDGSLWEHYAHLLEDPDAHPIFSEYTKRKVDGVLAFSPLLMNTYFGWNDDAPLLLTYSPSPHTELTSEQKELLRIKLWQMIIGLLPPKDVQEVIYFTNIIIRVISQQK